MRFVPVKTGEFVQACKGLDLLSMGANIGRPGKGNGGGIRLCVVLKYLPW